ncbi:MAG: CBS domain-containing protein [Deltaproteobacteria bacterium]|nr:CBS domain-containing protein [Deltaproteobacteria bacterium]
MNLNGTVNDFMDKRSIVLRAATPIAEAMEIFLKNRLLAAFVVHESGAVIGVLSENDCLRVLLQQTYHHQQPEDTVANFMREAPMPITRGTAIGDAARLFLDSRHRLLPVVEDGKFVGQVSRRGLILAIHRYLFSPPAEMNPADA